MDGLTKFDIKIKDNFFSKEDFDKIYSTGENMSFVPDQLVYNDAQNSHVWFTKDAPEDIQKIIIKNVSKYFNKKIIKLPVCQYTFVFKSDKVEAHMDANPDNDFQTLIYVKGNPEIHCGTGFYVEKDNEYVLNTHVGFMPNRLVSWTPNVYHAPLSFTDEFKPRISLTTQYKFKE